WACNVVHRRRHGRSPHGRALSARRPAINTAAIGRTAMRVAIITGGMGGLGEAISTKMHTAGYRVVVTHSPGNTRVKDWLGEHSAAGRELSAYAVDVTDIDSCRECVERVTKDIGPIDILVNNAGITKDTTFKKM